MALEMSWYIDQRVICSRFYGEVTEDDLIVNGAQVDEYIQQGTRPMFLILHTLDMTQYPTNIKEALEAISKNRPQTGDIVWTIIVSDNRFINFVSTITANFFKISVRSVKSLAEAEAFIAYHAPDLAPALEARREKSDSVAS
jgi:hypothetical protein